jgi:UDPglucose 6-dehydrogenase/GDP-mannose 6-dehydrogenase
LVAFGEAAGEPMTLLDTVIKINLKQPQKIIEILERNFPSLDGLKVCILGLAFKPDTDDVRESPAIPIARELLARGAIVSAFDPVANDSAKKFIPAERVRFVDSLDAALRDVDAAVLVTSWDVFRRLPEITRDMSPAPLIVDGRRMLDKRQIARYAGIGV